MKPIYQTILVLSCIAIFITISCKNKSYNDTPTNVPQNLLFADLKSTPQSFTVTAGSSQTIIGKDSTVINFYPNSFKDKNGNIITSGSISVQLLEMYKPGDMIANHTSATAGGGQLIQSGGQINVTASMNGQEVFANKYGIAFKQKGSSSNPMQLFYGGTTGTDSVTTWTIDDTTKVGTKSKSINKNDTTTVHYNDSSHHYNNWPNIYYLFDSCTKFNWINCDHFFGDSTLTASISVNVPDNSFTASNTQIYIVYPAINSTQTFYGTYNSTGISISNSSIKLPKSQNIDVVVITVKSGIYYYYQQTGIPTAATISVNATLAKDTKDDVIARLGGL